MKRNSLNNNNELAKTLYSIEENKLCSMRSLLDESKWKTILTFREICILNEVYDRFYFSIPMLVLESGINVSRNELWERFLIHEEPKKGILRRAWDKISGKEKWQKAWADADASRAEWFAKQHAASQTSPKEIDVDVSEFSKPDDSKEDDGRVENVKSEKCGSDELKDKLMSAIKNMKYSPSAHDRVVSRIMNSIKGAPQASSAYGLKKLIKSKNPKMRNSSIEIFVAAIEGCYGDSENAVDENGMLSSGELDKLTNLVSGDFNDYLIKAHDKKSTYKKLRPVNPAGIKKVVDILNQNKKLKNGFDNRPDLNAEFDKLASEPNDDIDAKLKQSLGDSRRIINGWVNTNPEMMDNIRNAVDGNDLPLWLLANRKAIVEMIFLIHKYANKLLIEKSRCDVDTVLVERWQRLAGIL